jgi:hypothetical protein
MFKSAMSEDVAAKVADDDVAPLKVYEQVAVDESTRRLVRTVTVAEVRAEL